MELISLGSNCSVTSQLDKLGLRTKAYPFDWSKISLNQLINVLSNNFIDYAESIEFKKESNLHPIINYVSNNIDNSNSIIVKNNYGITFAHELGCKYEVEEFREKIKTRIERFRNLSKSQNKITFVRIELCPIKSNWSDQIYKLINLLNMIISPSQYELILIINSLIEFEFPSNIKIYKFYKFSSDWKMDDLDWNNIFNLFL